MAVDEGDFGNHAHVIWLPELWIKLTGPCVIEETWWSFSGEADKCCDGARTKNIEWTKCASLRQFK